jgi:hypothetical protein
MTLVKSFLTADRLQPPAGKVVLEALYADTYDPLGKILVPEQFQRRYPHLARVIAGGHEEGLQPGDMVILEDEGYDGDRTYYDVFKLILSDGNMDLTIVVDNELEPALREKVTLYRRHRTSHDVKISVQDVNDDQWWTFNCSDVKDWTWDFQSNTPQRLEYIPAYMIEVMDPNSGRFKMIYIADLKIIMAKLGEEDDELDDRTGSDQDRLPAEEGRGLAGVQGAHH